MGATTKKRILVVDDERLVRESIGHSLELRGHQVDTCDDGITALSFLARHKVDLILVDFVMPRLNGYHFVRALQAKKMAVNTPIVLMSALTDKIRERFGRMTGVRDYLAKPFTTKELFDTVERHLGGDIEVDVDLDEEPLTVRDDHWMLVASVRETLQAAISARIGTHVQKLGPQAQTEDLRRAVAGLLDDVFDESLCAELIDLVHTFQERER